jgi:hypothetical protein
MKKLFIKNLFFILLASPVFSQNSNSPLDMLSFGLVLDDPGMKSVVVQQDVKYFEDAKGSLHIDIYSPSTLKQGEKRPAIIFLNAIGENPGNPKVKSWGIYSTWPKLMAAQGYIGISMESDGDRIQESLQGLFNFLESKGSNYNIDKDRLGVYAASANVTQSSQYLMSAAVSKGIKAAVLYYGRPPQGPFRKDLPVLFLVSEGDMNAGYNGLWGEVIKNNAPWTIKMGTGMPHAFDAVSDNDQARVLVKETISFWKNHLDPVPAPSWKYSKGREVLGSLQMDRPKAMELLKSLVAEYPNDGQTLSVYANQLRQDKKYDEAAVIYKKLLAFQPDNTEALTTLAVIAYVQNKHEEAHQYIAQADKTGKISRNDEKAIAISPSSFDSYNLACAYAKQNDVDNAVKSLDYALKHGYGSKQQIDNDEDFNLIRSNDKFKVLVSSLK